MDDEPVPVYSRTNNTSRLFAGVESLQNSSFPATAGVAFPITRQPIYPQHYQGNIQLLSEAEYQTQFQAYLSCDKILSSFFNAVTSKQEDVVTEFVSRGVVSPDVVSGVGETPLIAAVRAGDVAMIRTLVMLGATVDGFGKSTLYDDRGAQRTPLQLAAATGKLAMVRFLIEDCGADDAIIAPDGALALRLAAANGHREIVEYLPTRRGGEWLRWKTSHRRHMAALVRALKGIGSFVAVFVWYIPKWTLYDMPKGAGKAMWKRRHRFKGWCKRTIVELPTKLKGAGKALWRGAKKAPRKIWEAIKSSFQSLWKVIRAIPEAVEIALKWLASGVKGIWDAVAHIVLRAVSFLHTLGAAIVSFFRELRWQDVADGFSSLLHAIFVGIPKAIGTVIANFGEVSYDMLKALFGVLGKVLWYLALGMLCIVLYIPKKIGQVLVSLARSIISGFREVMVWFDPKRM